LLSSSLLHDARMAIAHEMDKRKVIFFISVVKDLYLIRNIVKSLTGVAWTFFGLGLQQ
jgi:hypothetical protein